MRSLTEEEVISHIPELSNVTLRKITKGYSFDLKYVTKWNGKDVLLRLYEVDLRERVQEKVEKMKAFKKLGVRCQEVYAFGEVPEENFCYTICSFLEGQDSEAALAKLTTEEQYAAGYEAGLDLDYMHQLRIEASMPEHVAFIQGKFEKAVERYSRLDIPIPFGRKIIDYVRNHIHLIGESRLVFAHHDFHAGNLIIHKNKYAGVIDFNRCGVNTANSEFDKLELFSSRLSIPFSKGVIHGYFKVHVPELFWKIRSVHMAQLLIYHMNWATDYFPEDLPQAKEAIQYVWEMYEGFERTIPKWYEGSQA
ncbi:aminoglycoside phosphotransferase family protein [Anaerobacillus sp. 1_MG-2023]|uniref:aminoglycoside phosphotransferase family protein n=1 Tax=Anaerobacillus sp. 1_MG-2023 TaxID=3062655 RepID=UPI0026E2FF45|nr:aminoglycoside phosphotransferase family protein [Anaerobacillus sp. 1_MG-2023]MDO6654859.1 aminoglycoside phosphotransferase family protein [Anaerobacillus sp. 1_MG-2023]